jgi:uncharacterized Zn finger protein (UPF0148 family)
METRCESCGTAIGQHDLSGDRLMCPSCGATVTVSPGGEPERAEAAPPGRPDGTETFSGEETVEDVMREIREKGEAE